MRASIEGDAFVYDNDACATCYNLRSGVPICTILNIFLDSMAEWAGLEKSRTIETLCKAMGSTTYRYEVFPGR